LLQVLGTMGRLSGELAVYTNGGTNVTNNTLIVNSPAFAKLQSVMLAALAPFPEARLAVIGALRSIEDTGAETASLPAPTIPAEVFAPLTREPGLRLDHVV
jgi:hypothetical protein